MIATVLWVLADGSAGDEWRFWAQYGVLGLVVLGFITRRIVSGLEVLERDKIHEGRLLQLQTENNQLRADNAKMFERIVATLQLVPPALEASTKTMDEALVEIRRLRDR